MSNFSFMVIQNFQEKIMQRKVWTMLNLDPQ